MGVTAANGNRADTVEPDHQVVIIGAGLGGIGVAIKLKEAGFHDVVLLERADDIGGTWRANTYPGIASDVPAQVYQFSFELNPDWSHVFAPGHEIMGYIRRLADKYRISDQVRCGHEVLARTWDDEHHLWRLDTPHGEITARYVISAIGAFVDPKPVDIPGIETFAGTVMHTASWDHSVNLTGRRVALIGTGASAVQIVPEIADAPAHLDVYQRTPIWVGPKPDLATPRPLRWLFRKVPAVQEAVRRFSTSLTETALIGGLLSYEKRPYFANGVAAAQRGIWYRLQVRDPALRAALTPQYGFGCKRPSVSNQYLRRFTRPHVDLITAPIAEVTPTGVRTEDGAEHPADVLVLATGFRMATDPANYERTPVRGRDGFDLARFYADERLKSYEGVSLPGLPNHFIVFGPYGWIGGTWHQLVEIAAAHAIRVMQAADRLGATMVEVQDDACERWTESMRNRFSGSLFLSGNCATANSYYFDKRGDVPYLRPTSSKEAIKATAGFPLDDYRFVGPDGAPSVPWGARPQTAAD
jgi:cation diffusion facilitator CzcD-associated flavoprotein CzcO